MRILVCLLSLFFFSCVSSSKVTPKWDQIESVFAAAPDSIQTSIYWYWISDHLSKEGVIKDLQAMKRVGINRAFIGNIGLDEIPKEQWGKVKIFSDEWWDILHTALKTATELNIDIGIFNSPGWSQSGGPWVKENQAMRYLHAVDTLVKGSSRFIGKMKNVPTNFQPTHVLAFQIPKDYHSSLANSSPEITSTLDEGTLTVLVDKLDEASVKIPVGRQSQVTFTLDNELTARSLTVYIAKRRMAFNATLQVEQQGEFLTVKQFRADRMNTSLNVGFDPYAPVTVSFDAVQGKKYRVIFDHVQGDAGISEIELTSTPKVERFKEKSLAKMHPTPLPYWHDYLWPNQNEVDPTFAIDPSEVKDLTSLLSNDGMLDWEVPSGEWIILQTGMIPTGVTNMPTSAEGRGLEVDKMSSKHIVAHFDGFLGEIMRRIPAEDRKSFKVAVQDSYETGGQNWTDDFEQKFKQAFGYDPKPYLPVFYGFVVGSQDKSDRFLWDVRRFVADQIAYEYVGGLRKVGNKHGLTTWLENYGHWGFPGEFLQYGGQSNEIGGEFWSEGELGDIENRAASSAAHIYGKNRVSAESFTSAGNTFGRYPAMLKERGDRFFAEGINNTLLHVYIHQPYEDKLPGVNTWFGTEFNRSNTWFFEMKGFLDYLKRCNYLLQQGHYVADVAYFIGEDAPKMTGVQDPSLPQGYAFDYMNAEVILNRMTIKNGRFTLPDGVSYKVLVLPQLETIRPEVLNKVEKLVKEGGVVLGPKPKRSPSLTNFGNADGEVQQVANKMWGNINGETVKKNMYGAGMVLQGLSLQEALDLFHIKPDVRFDKESAVHYIHRKHETGDIYFLTNQSGQKLALNVDFRVTKKQPELWDALTGQGRILPEYEDNGETTKIPLELSAQGSVFVIFRNDTSKEKKQLSETKNFSEPIKTIPVSGKWEVTFTNPDSSTFKRSFDALQDWSKHADTTVNYFSGSADYTIDLPMISDKSDQKIILNLGQVVAIAQVSVNGRAVGNVWTPPYQIDITDFCNDGTNIITVRVTNTWVNRLIGDQRLPKEKRSTWTIVNPYQANSQLHSSGLLGPVSLDIYEKKL